MESDTRPGEIIALSTPPAAPMLIVREDFFSHTDEQATFEEAYGRELEVPHTWQERYKVDAFFTRKAIETIASETLEHVFVR